MDIETLNHDLMELTESERGYQAGTKSGRGSLAWDERTALHTEDGVIRLPEETIILRSYGYGANVGRGRRPIGLDSQFYLRKHSRFNRVSEHVHAYVEISYMYHGMCRQLVNGRDLLLLENQVLLLDSDCPHAIEPLGADDIMITICLKKALLSRCFDTLRDERGWLTDFLINMLDDQADHNRYVHFCSEKNRRVRRFFQELMCEYFDPSHNANHIILGLFQLTLAELMNVYEEDYVRREREQTGSKVSTVSLMRHIQENYLTCTLESVAGQFFVTPNYVSKLLKQSTGKTYMQIVQEQRLTHAAALLRSGAYSIEEAARVVGYENVSFFYRKFKAAYGMTPAAYRDERA